MKAPMILNGVCVIWKGWIDLQRLDGMGCLEFDEERAQQEDALAQQAFEEARRRTREFEDRDRSHREEMEVRVSQLLSVTGFCGHGNQSVSPVFSGQLAGGAAADTNPGVCRL